MAEVDASKLPSLAEQYLVEEKEKKPESPSEMAPKTVEDSEVKPSIEAPAEETVQKTDESPSVVESVAAPAAEEESKEATPADETTDNADQESNDNSENQEAEEAPEIKLETAPADFRFPTTNQTRHCFTRYIEYHRCIAAKGEEAPECDKFAKYYRSLCPGEWIDRWNEQRENGTFPGPL